MSHQPCRISHVASAISHQPWRATPVPRRRDTWLLIQSHLKGNSAARIVIDWIRQRFTLMARR